MTKRIDRLIQSSAQLIWKNLFIRHLFFLTAALITLFLLGYHFGTFDQSSHIPFLKKTADPGLYPNDHFFDLRKVHYSYFWLLFIPFYKAGILPQVMFIVHFLTFYLSFWMFWRLSLTLFSSPLTAFLSVFVFIFPHFALAGFTVFEFSLLNRTFVLPFLLLACDLYLNRRCWLSFFLLGLLYNIHVISANFVLGFFMIDILLRRKEKVKEAVKALGFFFASAWPVFAWKFGNSSIDLSVNKEWFSIIEKSFLHHIFFPFSKEPYIIAATACGIGTIILFFVAYSRLKRTTKSLIIKNFLYAALLILIVEIITAYFFPITIIIQSQIIRVGLFILIFGYLFFVAYLVEEYRKKKIPRADFYTLLSSIALLPFPVVFFVFWSLQQLFSDSRLNRYFIGLATMVIIVISGIVGYKTGFWRPKINIVPDKTPWYQVQLWARSNTPKETVFITPPHRWGFYMVEWRVGSERSTVVTLSELLEAAFAPQYISYWKPRFQLVAPKALSQFNGDYFTAINKTKESFYSLSEDEFIKIANKYKARFLVVEKPYHYRFPVVFENKGFIVYSLEGS